MPYQVVSQREIEDEVVSKEFDRTKKKVVKTEAITYMDTLLIRLFTAQELFNGVKVLKLGIQAICQENSR